MNHISICSFFHLNITVGGRMFSSVIMLQQQSDNVFPIPRYQSTFVPFHLTDRWGTMSNRTAVSPMLLTIRHIKCFRKLRAKYFDLWPQLSRQFLAERHLFFQRSFFKRHFSYQTWLALKCGWCGLIRILAFLESNLTETGSCRSL